MTAQQSIQDLIDFRFDNLYLGLNRGQQAARLDNADDIEQVETEQANARRRLLWVEKVAIRDKQLNAKSEQSYVDSIREMVHKEISSRLQQLLEDSDHLYSTVLGVDEQIPPLLDILSVKACSISRVQPLAAAMPWLYDDIKKLVNSPKYRKTDSKGKVITVENLRMALGFLGIENLKLVIPSLSFRRWIPQITDPFPQIKTRMWEHALGTALSCKKIAQVVGVEEGHAFTLGMLHEVGRIIIVRMYFRLFDQVQRDAISEAHDTKKREEHAALTKIVPSGAFLIQLMQQYGPELSSRMIEQMGMQRVFIANAMEEYASKTPIQHMSPMAQTLLQGVAYSKYRILKNYRLIEMAEAKKYLAATHMPNGALAALKTTDLRSLNLHIEDD